MKKYLYWFTDDFGRNACNDFYGTYSQCEKYAQKMCDILGDTIYINCEDDIVGVVYPESTIF